MATLSHLGNTIADTLGLTRRNVRAIMRPLKGSGLIHQAPRSGREKPSYQATVADAALILMGLLAPTAYGLSPTGGAHEAIRRLREEDFMHLAGWAITPLTMFGLSEASPLVPIAQQPQFVFGVLETAIANAQAGVAEDTLARIAFSRRMGVALVELVFRPVAEGAPAYQHHFAAPSDFARFCDLADSVGGREALLNRETLGLQETRAVSRFAIEKIGQALGPMTQDARAHFFPEGIREPDHVAA